MKSGKSRNKYFFHTNLLAWTLWLPSKRVSSPSFLPVTNRSGEEREMRLLVGLQLIA